MNFRDLVNSLSHDTTGSLALFRPELALCATIVLMLLLRSVPRDWRIDSFCIALIGSAVGLWFAAPWQHLKSIAIGHAAGNVHRHAGLRFVHDLLPHVLLLFAVLFVIFTQALRHSRPRRCRRFLLARAGRRRSACA